MLFFRNLSLDVKSFLPLPSRVFCNRSPPDFFLKIFDRRDNIAISLIRVFACKIFFQS